MSDGPMERDTALVMMGNMRDLAENMRAFMALPEPTEAQREEFMGRADRLTGYVLCLFKVRE